MSAELGAAPSRVTQLSRRVRWRLHWALRGSAPLADRSWWNGMTLLLPRSGSAATAYYRTFPSREIAAWMPSGWVWCRRLPTGSAS